MILFILAREIHTMYQTTNNNVKLKLVMTIYYNNTNHVSMYRIIVL